MSKEKTKEKKSKEDKDVALVSGVANKEELKAFLLNVRDKLSDKSSAPIYALTGMNYVLNLPNVYDILSDENKELARDIWLRLKQAGVQVKAPPMLFKGDEAV